MLLKQLRQNSLAYLGLVVAVSSLLYVSWRHEQNQYNANIRTASFHILGELGELQTIIHFAHYEKDVTMGHPIKGWGHVLLLKDLAMVMPESVSSEAQHLAQVWEKNWSGLGKDKLSVERIRSAIDKMRQAVVAVLQSLD